MRTRRYRSRRFDYSGHMYSTVCWTVPGIVPLSKCRRRSWKKCRHHSVHSRYRFHIDIAQRQTQPKEGLLVRRVSSRSCRSGLAFEGVLYEMRAQHCSFVLQPFITCWSAQYDAGSAEGDRHGYIVASTTSSVILSRTNVVQLCYATTHSIELAPLAADRSLETQSHWLSLCVLLHEVCSYLSRYQARISAGSSGA